MKKSVSIIIPNYNGKKLLEAYLPYTLDAIKATGTVYELIVVDDCSKDDSVDFIKQSYPQVILLQNPVNQGFSYSCNQGIKAAQHELIFLLNSDVKLTASYFAPLWKYFECKDTFGVMGRIIDMEGDGIQDAARIPAFSGYKLKTAYFYYTENTADELYTTYLSGANALIDSQKIKSIGGFDELFSPFYGEDFELGLRSWLLGWKCYYEHQAVCRHQVSASTKNYKTARWVKSIYYRNRFYVHAIHLNGLPLIMWYLQITLIDFLPKLLAGQFWIWNSYKNLFMNRASIKASKKKFQYLMQVHNSHLTVFDVVKKIKQSVKNKNVIKFGA